MNTNLRRDESGISRIENSELHSRRGFLQRAGLMAGAAAAFGLPKTVNAADKIPGLESAPEEAAAHQGWQPFSDRKLRVGLVGYGVCKFAPAWGFQAHPNVEVIAVSDLIPERCAELAKVTPCDKTYPSCEEMVRDRKNNKIEAVFLATDAPSHARLAIDAMEHGMHVATCVPAVYGSLDDAEKLFATVKRTGLKYMMFETSAMHEDNHAMRQLYNAGAFGKVVYSEGEYYHYMAEPIDSYKGWRIGGPPMWYPTHSNAYHICVTGGSFTEVSCIAKPSLIDEWNPKHNKYNNPFGTEVALFRTNDGGMSRMTVSFDTPGPGGETGRLRGEKGSFFGKYEGLVKTLPHNLKRPPLPPKVEGGGHEGSQGHLMNEFVTAIIQDRKPLVDVGMALNLTVSGIIAHKSALKEGELLKIPQYKL